VDSGYFASSSFWTLPSDTIPPLSQEEQDRLAETASHSHSHDDNSQAQGEEVHYDPLSMWMLNGHSIKSSSNAFMESQWASWSSAMTIPQTTCILGDIVNVGSSSAKSTSNVYRDNIFDINVKSNHSTSSQSILKSTSVLLAWNDTRLGSDADLRAEEVAYKQYRHDLKKFEKQSGIDKKGGKKPNIAALDNAPVHVRPRLTDSLLSVLSTFPLQVAEEGATRSLNRVVSVGPDINLFILDSRNGYLGKSQAKWLRDELEASHALWKIVLSGTPLGYKVLETVSKPLLDRSLSTSLALDAAADANLDTGNGNGNGEGESKIGGEGTAAAIRRDRSVSVLLPAAIDHDDMDECGVPKSSLQYVMASIQKRIDSKNKLDAGSHDGSDVEVTSQVSSKEKLGSSTSGDFELNSAMSASTVLPSDDSVLLESGIVIFSSGGVAPFAATYDPAGWGRAFLAEVQIGSVLNRDVSEQCYPNMTPQFSFQGVASNETSCNVSLMEDGGLKVSILDGANMINECIYRTLQKK
jgi:hypothetical protein